MHRTLDSYDSGSNYSFGDKLQRPNLPRSLFSLDHLNTMTIENAGMLVPIALIETVPGDSMEINVESLLRVLPLAVPLYSRQRMYIHGFYSRLSDLWTNGQTFMTKGFSGNTVYSIPTLNDDNLPGGTLDEDNNPVGFTAVQAGDLFDYLGLPIGMTRAQIIDANISALPFMMYTRIYRDYYLNRNYYIDSRKWLPDDDYNFRMDNDGLILSHPDMDDTGPQIGVIYYRDYPQDYFLSALPFPQRGDTPTLDFGLTTGAIPVGLTDDDDTFHAMKIFMGYDEGKENFSQLYTDPGIMDDQIEATNFNISNRFIGMVNNISGNPSTYHAKNFPLNAQLNDVIAYSSITLNQLRELSSNQAILEKMAKTDGTYAEFGLTFFGRSSKNALDYRPTYIGGCYQSIAFTEVLQTTPTAESPLGTYAGHGISYNDRGYIGRVDCDDYGYIMLIASIMPDVYYHQGIDRALTRSLQSDFYLPERARLGMREILNKEIYFSGSPETDNDLFAYQSPYDELRYKASRIHGKIADPDELSFYPYTQARTFNSLPTYSQSLARADDVRKDYLSAPLEVAYTAQFSIGIRAVRPIPYNPVPAQII